MRLQPAWLVSADDGNAYNLQTQRILASLSPLEVRVGEGNVIFPEGNANKYLSEYFTDNLPENPYEEDERDVRCVSFSASGDVLSGNVYEADVMEILENYRPQSDAQ